MHFTPSINQVIPHYYVYTYTRINSSASKFKCTVIKLRFISLNMMSQYSLVYPSAARNKKQKKQTNRQISSKSTSSEHIQTRLKKGVIKNNHKYCD